MSPTTASSGDLPVVAYGHILSLWCGSSRSSRSCAVALTAHTSTEAAAPRRTAARNLCRIVFMQFLPFNVVRLAENGTLYRFDISRVSRMCEKAVTQNISEVVSEVTDLARDSGFRRSE